MNHQHHEYKKLHLGCGEKYMEGYCNIDYPPSEQTVQTNTVADIHADITTLQYAHNSIDEVRLHHVFEHFNRVQAIKLLIEWHQWLRIGGTLIIETPDFRKCAKVALFHPSMEKRFVAMRHIFGSHEAQWAAHWDGWYKAKYAQHLTALGYADLKFEYSQWQGTYNITVFAKKQKNESTKEQYRSAEKLLELSCLKGETRMLEQWKTMLYKDSGI